MYARLRTFAIEYVCLRRTHTNESREACEFSYLTEDEQISRDGDKNISISVKNSAINNDSVIMRDPSV